MVYCYIVEGTVTKIRANFWKTDVWALKKMSRNKYIGGVYLFIFVTQRTDILPYTEEIQIEQKNEQSRWSANMESLQNLMYHQPKWCKPVTAKICTILPQR